MNEEIFIINLIIIYQIYKLKQYCHGKHIALNIHIHICHKTLFRKNIILNTAQINQLEKINKIETRRKLPMRKHKTKIGK